LLRLEGQLLVILIFVLDISKHLTSRCQTN